MKKYRLLSSFLATTTMFATTTALCSCSKDESRKIAISVLEKGYEEFLEIAKVPRPSGHTYNIRNYLINRIKALGYEPKTDFDSLTDQQKANDSQETSAPVNIWFDVPASAGYENHKKIILQGHMDMVVAGLAGESAWKTGIEVEYHEDNHSLTSKDHKTSLGADDGIGLGVLLALIQNKNIKHGPLRILITADEEIGMVGAKRLPAEVLEPYDYLLNLDGELDYEGYYRSCQGAIQYNYGANWVKSDIVATNTNKFEVFVEGFKGGHSGNDINKGRANADVFINWLLSELDFDSAGVSDKNVQLISYNHINSEGKESTPSSTAIPSFGRVRFATKKSKADVEASFEETKSWFKTKYEGEDWDKVQMTCTPITDASITKALSVETSHEIIALMSNCDAGNVGFIYGYIPEPRTNRPILSCNVCPLQIYDSDGGNNIQFTLSTNGRAVAANGMILIEELWASTFYSHFAQTIGQAVEQYCIYPWEPNDNDEIQKLAAQGYKNIGIDPYIRDTNGCVEPAPFCVKKPTLQQTCLGTKFEGVHTVDETCYLSNMVNSIRVMKYILENAK